MEEIFLSVEKLKSLRDAELIEEHGRRAARLRILEDKIEEMKKYFRAVPTVEDYAAEMSFQPLEEERETLLQQRYQIEHELRERRTKYSGGGYVEKLRTRFKQKLVADGTADNCDYYTEALILFDQAVADVK